MSPRTIENGLIEDHILNSADKESIACYYRPNVNGEESTDRESIREVVTEKCYTTPGFDVMPGEKWLDLGANIGAFALYCRLRGATAVCYEPDPECFKILLMNAVGCECVQAAVSATTFPDVSFRVSPKPHNHWRGTLLPAQGYQEQGTVPNNWAGNLVGEFFDGVKMDIEGSEGPILDQWLLPRCQKLVLEYHTSREPNVYNLERRLKRIKNKFHNVVYPASYDSAIRCKLDTYQPRFDETIFAWGPK